MPNQSLETEDPIAELVSALSRLRVVDLSPVLHHNMQMFPDHPDFAILSDARTFPRDNYFLQMLLLPEHTGFHVDAPAHVLSDHPEQTIDTFPPNVLWGVAKKLDVSSEAWEPGQLLSLSHFQEKLDEQGISLQPGEILFVEFGWDRYLEGAATDHWVARWWGANAPGFTEDLCSFLGTQRLTAIGTDTPTCDIAEVDGKIVTKEEWGHRRDFLPKGTLVLEGAHNLGLVPSRFYFVALPLRIAGGSGSPLRPVALFPSMDGDR